MPTDQTVVAFAGRRIDAPGSHPQRFPSEARTVVFAAIESFLDRRAVRSVVGSCACGADILLLEAAAARGLGTRIILPFASERFRETSVIDRGSEWGPRYDALIARASHEGDVLVLATGQGSDDDAYDRVTLKIIEETLRIAKQLQARPLALAIWDQQARSGHDATQDFLNQAAHANLSIEQISTLGE